MNRRFLALITTLIFTYSAIGTGSLFSQEAADATTADSNTAEATLKESAAPPDDVGKTEPAAKEREADPAADATGDEEAASDGETEADPPAEGNQTTASDGTASDDAQAEWARVFAQWKGILIRMREIQTNYLIAEPDAMADLAEQWDQKIEEGRQLMPSVRSAALAAQKAAPNSDRELTDFLIKMLQDEIRNDNFEVADELSKTLVETNIDEKSISNLAGICAYAVSDFARAQELLEAAESNGTLKGSGENFLSNLRENPDLADLWAAELKTRQSEEGAEAAKKLPRVRLETTAGDFVIELFENEAPETVGNFISLVDKGYYDSLTFHRVMHAFMAQGGCPDGNGQGGPGYKIYCECVLPNHRNHWRGSVSMAKTAARNTGGSQFFLNFVPTPHLNGEHTVFGRIVEGIENLSKIKKHDPAKENEPVTIIIKAEVLNKRDHDYVPNKVQ